MTLHSFLAETELNKPGASQGSQKLVTKASVSQNTAASKKSHLILKTLKSKGL